MTKTGLLTVLCTLEMVFATTAFAEAARTKATKAVAASDARPIAPIVNRCGSGFVCRQDLFDRNDPNNIRSDYHGPPAQPGQF